MGGNVAERTDRVKSQRGASEIRPRAVAAFRYNRVMARRWTLCLLSLPLVACSSAPSRVPQSEPLAPTPYARLTASEETLRARALALRGTASTTEFRAALGSAPERARDIYAHWVAFQDDYDRWSRARLLYVADWTRRYLDCLGHELVRGAPLNEREARALEKAGEDFAAKLADYQAKEALYGSDSDHERIEAYRALELSARLYATELARVGGVPLADSVERKPFRRFAKALTGQGPDALGILKDVATVRSSGPGETPTFDRVWDLVRHMGEREGFRSEWIGGPVAVRPPERDVVTWLAHSHAHPFYDYFVLADLKGRGYGSVGNLDHAFPRPAADRVCGLDHIVCVGRDDEASLDKMAALARRGKLSGYLVSTEGYTSAGLYDNRPNRAKLESVFWAGLKKRGLKLRIQPVTLLDTYRIANVQFEASSPLPVRLRAAFSAPLEPDDLERIAGITGDGRAIGRTIRAIWHEQLESGPDRLLGAPLLASQRARLALFYAPALPHALRQSCDRE